MGKQPEQQQHQQQGPFVVTRSAAAAPAPAAARGCADSMPGWLQDAQPRAPWQLQGIKQQPQQQQHEEGQDVSQGSDAMVWSPAKGQGPQ